MLRKWKQTCDQARHVQSVAIRNAEISQLCRNVATDLCRLHKFQALWAAIFWNPDGGFAFAHRRPGNGAVPFD